MLISPFHGTVRTLVVSSKPVPRFGNQYDKWDFDPYNPNPDTKAAEKILEFKEPHPKKPVQKLVLLLNRIISLPMMKVTPIIPPEEAAKLKAIPKEAGNVLVGPHPDCPDGNLMTNLFRVAGQVPAGLFMATEAIQPKNFLYRQLLDWYGIVPIRRGKPNPEAMAYLSNKIAKGGWGAIFPEGAIYYSRQVMPMEYGAIRIAVESALKVQQDAKEKGIPEDKMRPVLMTPFVHTYVHTDVKQMKAKMLKDLEELEKHTKVFGQAQNGEMIDRIKQAARKVMEARANDYGVAPDVYRDDDIYASAQKLENHLVEALEQKYLGKVGTGYSRRRAMKVRMEIYSRLKNPQLTDAEKNALKLDIDKSSDVVTLVSFDRDYKSTFNDIETWGEYLRRIRSVLGLSDGPFGHRNVIFKVLEPRSMHAAAKHYAAIPNEDEKMDYLFKLTEDLRTEIQQGVEALCKANPTEVVNA